MAITISGQNNNDKILASDGVLDSISGFNVVGVMTAAQFDVTGKTTTNHISIGNNIHLGNAGIITATTLLGNVTGNINHESNLLLQISGSEKFRVGNGGQFGIAGANYGTAGQVFTSGGSGSAPTWSTINSDKITEGNTEAEVVDTGSDGHFKVTTEGSERLRVESGGGLKFTGQGTSIPVAGILHHTNNNLYVRGGTSGLILGNQDNTNTIGIFDSNFIRFETNNGTERLRIGNAGQIGLSGENYGTSGQVLTSQGSGSAVAWTTISTDLVSDTSPQLGGDLDTNSHHILLDDSHSVKWGNGTELEILHTGSSGYAAVHNSQGNFLIDTTGNFYVRDTSGSKTSILANPAGSTELYYNNEKRLYTDSDGVTIGQSAYAQLKIDGQVGDCILSSSGAQIEFTRASASNILCSNSAGYLNFFTGGQTTYPAIRIFATPEVTTGAKVGINTDTIGVDTQMSVMASPGKPALYTSYGMRIMPNGANSFNYPSHYITNASGIYVIHTTIPANNTWTQVCAGRYHGATVTCRVGDASSKRTIFANYDFTAPNYGVAHYNEIANNGNWNTGSASMRVANAGTYDYALEVQHNSYYNTSNTSSVYLIFNVT